MSNTINQSVFSFLFHQLFQQNHLFQEISFIVLELAESECEYLEIHIHVHSAIHLHLT
jgi:hypothetical protein